MFMDGTTTYSCDTLVAGLILQSTPVDWWCLYWIHGDMDPSVYTTCHAPPQFDLMELHHMHTHLTTDCDLTQSRHCHTGQCRTVSDLAISHISGHLWTGRDSALTACAPHSATFSSTYF